MAAQVMAAAAPSGQLGGPAESEYIGYELIGTSIAGAAISFIFLVIRLCTRHYIVKMLGWDDLCVLLAWLSSAILTVTDCLQTKYGTGSHIWNVTLSDFERFLKLQLILGNTYICSLLFSKLALCLFYLRLSPTPCPGHNPRLFRHLTICLIVFMTSYSLAGFLVVVFSCNPIEASWDPKLAALPTTSCINRPADYIAQASLNILSDLLLIVLPLRTIWKLDLSRRQRCGVTAIFASGLSVTIVSIVRLPYIVHLLNDPDLTWNTNMVLILSTLETHLAIISAAIPVIKPLLVRLFPRNAASCRAGTPSTCRCSSHHQSIKRPISMPPTRPQHSPEMDIHILDCEALHQSCFNPTPPLDAVVLDPELDEGWRDIARTGVSANVVTVEPGAEDRTEVLVMPGWTTAATSCVYVTRTVRIFA